jgi:hypothetical protein
MNERIRELAEQAGAVKYNVDYQRDTYPTNLEELKKFAQLIVRDCLNIAKNWDDQLVSAKLVKESNAVGIVAYRIARQFGVEE